MGIYEFFTMETSLDPQIPILPILKIITGPSSHLSLDASYIDPHVGLYTFMPYLQPRMP